MWEVRVREPNYVIQDLIDLFLFDCLFTSDHDNIGTAGVPEALEAENTCLQLATISIYFIRNSNSTLFFCFGQLGCNVPIYIYHIIISTNININICFFSLLLSNQLGTVRCTPPLGSGNDPITPKYFFFHHHIHHEAIGHWLISNQSTDVQTHHLQAEFPEIPEMDLTFAPWFFPVRWIGGWMDREDLPVYLGNELSGRNKRGS